MQNNDINFDFDQEQPATSTPHTEGVDAAAPFVAKKKMSLSGGGIVDLLKRNWLYAVIGVVVLIIAWYLFTEILFPSAPAKPAPARKPVAAMPQSQAQWIDTQKPTVKTVAAQPTSSATTSAVSGGITLSKQDMQQLVQGFQGAVKQQVTVATAQLSQQLAQMQQDALLKQDQLTKNLQLAQQEVQVAKQEVKLLQQQVASINTKFDQYNQNLVKISQSLATTQQQLTLLVAEKAEDADQLTLRAVVPGRAWLVNSDGYTMTVEQGTSLPHYGTITKIDSDQGKVYTSSGYVFN